MSDLIREEFETWWSSTPILGENKRTIAEKAWQASRECLVIELPKPCAWDNDGGFDRESDPDSECSMALIPKIDVMQSIHAAGVKTK